MYDVCAPLPLLLLLMMVGLVVMPHCCHTIAAINRSWFWINFDANFQAKNIYTHFEFGVHAIHGFHIYMKIKWKSYEKVPFSFFPFVYSTTIKKYTVCVNFLIDSNQTCILFWIYLWQNNWSIQKSFFVIVVLQFDFRATFLRFISKKYIDAWFLMFQFPIKNTMPSEIGSSFDVLLNIGKPIENKGAKGELFLLRGEKKLSPCLKQKTPWN